MLDITHNQRLQTKSTMRYYLTPIRMTIIKKQQTANIGEDVKKKGSLCTVGGNVNWCIHCFQRRFPPKLKMELPYSSASSFWVFTGRKQKHWKKTYAHQCLLQHCLQLLHYGSTLIVHRLIWSDLMLKSMLFVANVKLISRRRKQKPENLQWTDESNTVYVISSIPSSTVSWLGTEN